MVLRVPRDATDAQIAQARRQLSREYHPDVNNAPDAAARFDEVQRAFSLLSDPAARAHDARRETPAPPRRRHPASSSSRLRWTSGSLSPGGRMLTPRSPSPGPETSPAAD